MNMVVTVAGMEVSSAVARSTLVKERTRVSNPSTAETIAEPQIWHYFQGEHSATWSDHVGGSDLSSPEQIPT